MPSLLYQPFIKERDINIGFSYVGGEPEVEDQSVDYIDSRSTGVFSASEPPERFE
jgi:hypothetical protein